MNSAENIKIVPSLFPQNAQNQSDLEGASVEVAGWGKAFAFLITGVDASWTDPLTVLILESSDDGSSWSTVTSSAYSGTGTTGLPQGNDHLKVWGWTIDLRAVNKRYLRIATASTANSGATYLAGGFVLLDPDVFPNSDSERGCEAVKTITAA